MQWKERVVYNYQRKKKKILSQIHKCKYKVCENRILWNILLNWRERERDDYFFHNLTRVRESERVRKREKWGKWEKKRNL